MIQITMHRCHSNNYGSNNCQPIVMPATRIMIDQWSRLEVFDNITIVIITHFLIILLGVTILGFFLVVFVRNEFIFIWKVVFGSFWAVNVTVFRKFCTLVIESNFVCNLMMNICGTIYAWTYARGFKTWYNWSTIVPWNRSTKRQIFVWLFSISDSQYSPLPTKLTQSSSKLFSALLTFLTWFLKISFLMISLKLFYFLSKDGDRIFIYSMFVTILLRYSIFVGERWGQHILSKAFCNYSYFCMGKCHGGTKRAMDWLLSLWRLISFHRIKLNLRSAVSITQILLLALMCQDCCWIDRNHYIWLLSNDEDDCGSKKLNNINFN